jgi:hypothetical protein
MATVAGSVLLSTVKLAFGLKHTYVLAVTRTILGCLCRLPAPPVVALCFSKMSGRLVYPKSHMAEG